MANRERGEVDVEIGGKTYTLRYSTNALAELEDALDKPINAVMLMLQDRENLRIKTIRAVVWAGFSEKHPEMSQNAVGDLISEIGFPAMMEKVRVALQAAFPDASADDSGDQARPQ